jgi:TolB-like protein/DNA-binding winged helix-turn-helix (wHTH) protein/Tfp pilus assembly protein PilF
VTIDSAHATEAAPTDLQIGEWRLDARGNELRRGAEVVRLEPKVTELLALLASRPGEVLARDELFERIWPGVVVGDDSLTQAVIKLRKALGDDSHSPRYIDTIPKRGYRLIAPVSVASPAKPGSHPRPASTRRGSAYVAIGVTLAALAALGALLTMTPTRRPAGADGRASLAASSLPTVAVLPLSNLSGNPGRDYVSEGMTEDLINALGRFSGLRVMSKSAVQGYRSQTVTSQAIRRDLGARYIVQGSVREAEGRLRVTVSLSDGLDGVQLGSENYEGAAAQLFEIQDRIVADIVGRLHLKLTELEQQRASAKPTESLEAHDLVLRARPLLARTERSANREARALLARAAELDSRHAEVHCRMAHAEFQRAVEGWVEDAEQAVRRAEALAKQALAAAGSDAHVCAHALLATVYVHRDRYEEALAHSQQAIELNPSDATALYWRGAASLSLGRVDEAIGYLETARRFEPRAPAGATANLAVAYYVAGRYAEALSVSDAMLTTAPGNASAHALRAAVLARTGKLEDARAAAEQVRRVAPAFEPENFGARFIDPKYKAMLRAGLREAGL